MDFQNSITYQNLLKAYDGELKASTKYRIYSHKAKDEGYEQIGRIFDETAINEQQHAYTWLRILNSELMPDTLANLQDAFEKERINAQTMYQEFADTAEQEGFIEIAGLFRKVAEIEQFHDVRFESLAQNLENGQSFCRTQKFTWLCMNCGFVYYDECAPQQCPVCKYPKGYFKIGMQDF